MKSSAGPGRNPPSTTVGRGFPIPPPVSGWSESGLSRYFIEQERSQYARSTEAGGLPIRVCSITLTASYSQRQRDDGGRAEVAG